jgi:hypothetical protein
LTELQVGQKRNDHSQKRREAPCYDSDPAMNTSRQREHWDGEPIELGDTWTLRKGERVARCLLVTHPLGWELRLMTNDLLRSQVCRSSAEVLDTHQAWKIAMLATGWA